MHGLLQTGLIASGLLIACSVAAMLLFGIGVAEPSSSVFFTWIGGVGSLAVVLGLLQGETDVGVGS